MKNKRWRGYDGTRHTPPARRRSQQRFRHHVRTPHNPTGRIRREPCYRHPEWTEGEAHHSDYLRPFLVVWCCPSYHRKIEAGTQKFEKRDLWDYSSLVIQLPGMQKPLDSDERDEPLDGVPF
jgi:hypothetical protein